MSTKRMISQSAMDIRLDQACTAPKSADAHQKKILIVLLENFIVLDPTRMPTMTITASSRRCVRWRAPLCQRSTTAGKRPSGGEIRAFVRRLVDAIRAHWPAARPQSLCAPEVLNWCRANRVDWIFGP